jgi:hypothetical protein
VSIRIQSVPVPRRKDWMTTVTKRSINNNNNNNNNNNTVGKKNEQGKVGRFCFIRSTTNGMKLETFA